MAFSIDSPAFHVGDDIPTRFAKTDANAAPPLQWGDVPPGTRSLALIVDDPDAPRGTFTHWMLWDLPATLSLLDGWTRGDVGRVGRNDFGDVDYDGPMPPPGHGPHRYFFRLFALDEPTLGLRDGATRAEVERAMRGHVLASTELMGRFERRAARRH